MKTRLLIIIIGIAVTVGLVSSIGMTQFSSVSYDVEYCQDWCDIEELSKIGCNTEVIDFINRATNIFDENFDNSYFFLNWIGLPDSISQEKFDECLDIIREKRVESLENTDLNSKGCPLFCSKKVADNVFSFCGGDGFYSEKYMFTKNSTHHFDHNECEWKLLDEFDKYLDEEGNLNFGSPYDRNGIIIDDLQRILDYCNYQGEKKSHVYFSWSNQTHQINSESCELRLLDEN